MTHDPRPIAPMNPEGLDDIAKALLEAYTPKTITPADIPNPESYLILEGKQYGTYSYPDLLVSMHRLGFTDEAGRVAQKLGLSVQNTAQEQNGVHYIGNVQHKQAIDLVKGLNFIPLTPRLYVDFLKEVSSGIDGMAVYDGLGNQIPIEKLLALWNEIAEVRSPYRGEWLDASFSRNGSGLQIVYHQILPDGSLKEVTAPLENCLMKDKQPGIDLHDWLNRANTQGLPPGDVKHGELDYWYPISEKVAGFGADSDEAVLCCFEDPGYSNASLGVRAAKIKA